MPKFTLYLPNVAVNYSRGQPETTLTLTYISCIAIESYSRTTRHNYQETLNKVDKNLFHTQIIIQLQNDF